MTAKRYRAKPREVEAIRYEGLEEGRDAVLAFMGGPEYARVENSILPGPGRGLTDGIRVRTFTEYLEVRGGQWIVRHERGGIRRHEVVTDHVFAAAFEPVPEDGEDR